MNCVESNFIDTKFQVPSVSSPWNTLFIVTVCKSGPVILAQLKNVNSPSSSTDLSMLDWVTCIGR